MASKKNRMFHIPPKLIRVPVVIVYDVAAVALSMFVALFVRFDFKFDALQREAPEFLDGIFSYMAINIIVTIAIFALFRLYNSLWKYASINEVATIVAACITSTVVQTVAMMTFNYHFPRSYTF